MGAGGRGIFALDVTDPETFGAGDVKWEFTAEDDPDLGYTFGEPVITRIGSESSGRWVAVFGNGYNSQDGQAYLYIVDLFEGPDAYIEKIALGEPGGNGLSGVAGWRDPATRTRLSRAYAGDLNGTIWRIDFDGTDASVVYDEGLFTDPDGRAITSTPNIAASPSGGLYIYFGTGKLIEDSDRLSASMDRFYALRDADEAIGGNFNNNGLAEVTISEAAPVDGQPPLRAVESDGIGDSGWYMELAVGNTSNGERSLAKPRVVFGTVILSTYQPIEDPCRPGGIQRTYVLDAISGGGSLPYCTNCGAVEVGTGAPFSPPVTIRQRDPANVGDITFPGNQDPSEPTDPGDFPGAPPADGGDPEGWCSEFGIPPLFEGGTFLPLGTICEGRQVWREAR
jgi:type IV pilus assembly protein PilY1